MCLTFAGPCTALETQTTKQAAWRYTFSKLLLHLDHESFLLAGCDPFTTSFSPCLLWCTTLRTILTWLQQDKTSILALQTTDHLRVLEVPLGAHLKAVITARQVDLNPGPQTPRQPPYLSAWVLFTAELANSIPQTSPIPFNHHPFPSNSIHTLQTPPIPFKLHPLPPNTTRTPPNSNRTLQTPSILFKLHPYPSNSIQTQPIPSKLRAYTWISCRGHTATIKRDYTSQCRNSE